MDHLYLSWSLSMKFNKITLLLLIALLAFNRSIAQNIGNPISAQGAKKWTLSASSNYSNIEIDNQKMIVKKHLAKASYGIGSQLDLFLLGGASQLKMKYHTIDYTDDYRFTYGAGFQWELLQDTPQSPIEIWINMQAIRFQSQFSFTITSSLVSQSLWRNYLDYDWREVNGTIGMSFVLNHMKIYGGGIGWLLQRIDKKSEFWNDQWWGPYKTTFQSGFWYGAAGGIEIKFPSEYKICVEAMALNRTNYQIMIGISQSRLYH